MVYLQHLKGTSFQQRHTFGGRRQVVTYNFGARKHLIIIWRNFQTRVPDQAPSGGLEPVPKDFQSFTSVFICNEYAGDDGISVNRPSSQFFPKFWMSFFVFSGACSTT